MMDRLETLKQIVAQNPADTFARYGLAMEHARAGQFAEALAQYEAILGVKPGYVAAWYQGGQALERLGRREDAKQFYRRGIEATTKSGDGHARDQFEAALDTLG
jgi:tetratricopeptide (TPR) repeat protein